MSPTITYGELRCEWCGVRLIRLLMAGLAPRFFWDEPVRIVWVLCGRCEP